MLAVGPGDEITALNLTHDTRHELKTKKRIRTIKAAFRLSEDTRRDTGRYKLKRQRSRVDFLDLLLEFLLDDLALELLRRALSKIRSMSDRCRYIVSPPELT